MTSSLIRIIAMKPICLVLPLIFFLTSSPAQTPVVRNGHAMVYDNVMRAIILFGGADDAMVYGDTWSYTNGKWEKLKIEGPSPRTFPAMVMADDYILLFGGNEVLFGDEQHPVHYLDDTWLFRDGQWKKIVVPIHPGPRAEAAVGYDPVSKMVLLFGGRLSGEKWIADDSWAFDGAKWTPISQPGPSARSGAVLCYDQDLRKLILFGGNPVIAKEKTYNGPMWSWDGKTWQRMDSADSLVFNCCMVYDAAEHYLIRYGGWNGRERMSDTWIYGNKKWVKLSLTKSPPARNHAVMVYDPDHCSCVLYGGHDGENVFGDLWSFKNGSWNLLNTVAPRKRVENGH
jgi:Galactose oxidase, central domain